MSKRKRKRKTTVWEDWTGPVETLSELEIVGEPLSELKIVAERDGRRFVHRFKGPLEIVEDGDGGVLVRSLKGESLWGYVGDEPYLGNLPGEVQRTPKEQLYFAKVFYKDARGIDQVACENPPRSYSDLQDAAVLDTQDVARAAGCSPLTVLRHANAGRLKMHRKSSPHDFYYRKRDVENWLKKAAPFKRGRPLRRGEKSGGLQSKPGQERR